MTTSAAAVQETSFTDKRYFPRWEVKNRVLFQKDIDSAVFLEQNDSDCEVHEGYTKDLSCAGTCLLTNQTFNLHQKIKLVIYLSEEVSLSLQGIVVWIKSGEPLHEIGVIFYNTPAEAQDLMLQFAFSLNKERFLSQVFKGWGEK